MKSKVFMCMIISLLFVQFNLSASGKQESTEQVKDILIWSWQVAPEVTEPLIKNTEPLLEKEMGIKIVHECFPGISESEFVVKVINTLKFEQGPDIIEATGAIFTDLAYEGVLDQVPDVVDQKLQKAVLPAYQKITYFWDKSGKLVPILGTMTRQGGNSALWWNKEMYADAGLSGSPLTLNEALEYGKKLTKTDAKGNITRSGYYLRTGGHVGGIADKWTSYFYAAGQESAVKVDSSGKVTANFNTEAGRAICQFYLDGLYSYKMDAIGLPGDYGALIKGEIATLCPRETWVVGRTKRDKPDMYPKLGVGPIPVPKKGMPFISTTGVTGMGVISKASKARKEAAWRLLDRLNDDDMVKIRANDYNSFLPYVSAASKPPFDATIWKEYLKTASLVKGIYPAPRFATAFNMLGEQLQLIYAKEKTIEKGLSDAENAVNDLLKELVLQK